MDYYILKPACASSETGKQYPQVQKMSPGYNYSAKNSVHALAKAYQALPDYAPNLDYFVLHNQAKLSDLLSTSMAHGGFLISEKLKTIFEQFDITTHKFYPANVCYKKEFYNYYWMHIISDLTDTIDYPKSSFFAYYNYAHNLGDIKVESKEDFVSKEAKLKADNPDKTITIWIRDIFFINNPKFDLFDIGSFDANYYVSSRLYNAIIEANVTGILITPAHHLHIK